MGVVLTQYRHEDAELWPLIGPFIASREVVKALGGPVFSDQQTAWWVATDGDEVVGWASVQEAKGAYWLASAWVVPDKRGDKIHVALADVRDKHLASLPPKTVKVCCRMARWQHYEERGFHQDQVKGDWVYGSKLSTASKGKK